MKTLLTPNKKSILFLSFFFMVILAKAVPADPKPFIFKQPDNTELTVYLKGDERMSWEETQDGYTILYSEEAKGYVYAIHNSEKKLVTTSFLAHNPANRSSVELSFLSMIPQKLGFSNEEKTMLKRAWAEANQSATTAFPATGKRKLLCILIGFQDKAFTKTQANFDSLMNQVGYDGTGSVHDYFAASSFNKFDLHVDVAGPYTAANNLAYYGGDQGTWKDVNVRELISEAMLKAYLGGVDFSQYDNDKNGYVDGVCVIYAGYSQAVAGEGRNTEWIWPHQGNLNPSPRYNGVYVNNYFCASELSGTFGSTLTPIGTICHEFGHTIGLPDYYDADYDRSGGESVHPGNWSVMASGCYLNNGKTPPYWDMYSRSLVKWNTWTRLSSSKEVSLQSCGVDTIGYYFESPVNNEFFFIENRQQTGWDRYLPGHGMLIYHVDRNYEGWSTNRVNADPSHMAFDIEEAVPRTTGEGSASDPFPGTGKKTEFTDNTTPNAKTWSGKPSNSPIKNITESDGIISFYFKGEPTVSTDSIKNISSNSAICSGRILNYGAGGIKEKGICWAVAPTVPRYDINDKSTTLLPNSDTGIISCALTGLAPNTTYNVRVYARTNYGTEDGYGATLQFRTNETGTPVINTTEITDIDTNSAVGHASIIDHGSSSVTETGFCWSKTNTLPTITDSRVTNAYSSDDVTGKLTSLSPSIMYYVRAYVKNSAGYGYGNTITFYTNGLPIKNNNISGDSMICSGTAPDSIKGTLPTGGSGIFTYEWQQSYDTIDWIPASGTNTTIHYKPTTLYSPTYFRRIATSGALSATSNTAFTNVTPTSLGGTVTMMKSPDSVERGIVIMQAVDFRGTIETWQRSVNKRDYPPLSKDSVFLVDTLTSTGTYTYRIRVKNGICPAVISDTISVVFSYTGIENVENMELLEVYPNPTTGIFTLTIANTALKNADLTVTNLLGKTVYQKPNMSFTQNEAQNIDLSKLPQGVYFIKLTSGNHASYTQKITIVR